ncbi:MAG: hypothetical protein GEV09_15320 [Pseudonocardiaceae bacterium]|nr:hypothetical protein [Pseudonocardiaceae bacterium]
MQTVAPRYPHPRFAEPLPHEYLYAGLTVDPPTHAPVVRSSAKRDRVLDQCRALVREIETIDGVADATVFEAVLIPPLEGVPRFDVTLLTRTTTPDVLAHVQSSDRWQQLGADFVMAARNTRRIGDTERTRSATFLFNHFTADDAAGAVEAWEDLAGWYTAKTGADNSTLLQPTSEAPYAFINYVRLPHGAARFMLAQLSRPSFHTYVRRTLRQHGMVALPLLCKPA